MLALLFAGALFAADITILAVYDGSTLSQWQAGISINTIVSTISTVAMFTLMNPLGGAVGQCKWISFRKTYQPLIHYAHLDSASRGPYGSLKLFWERKWYGKLPALGAALMIMTLAVNPFMQQLIRVDTRDSATTGALLPVAKEHASNGGGSFAPDLRLKAAAYSGFVGPLDSTYNVTAVCHSGNCTWPQFNTLGVCSSCTNITEQIQGSDQIMSLRNGLHLNAVTAFFGAHMGQQTYLNVTTTKNLYQRSYSGTGEYNMYNLNNMSLVYADRGALIIDFLALRAPYGNLEARVAHECVLQYCVKTLIAAQVSGELVETEVSSWMNNTQPARLYADDAVLTTPVEDPDSNYELESTASEYFLKPPEQDHEFTVALESQIQMTTWFNAFLRGNASWVMPRTGEVYSNDQIQGIDSSLDQSETGLSRLMANVADAMTVALRTNSNETFGGLVHTNEAYIHIRWPWIALPLAIYLLVVAFLAMVALSGRSGDQTVQVWKNSGISAMLHGPEAESLRRRLGPLDKQSEIDGAAKDLVVRLLPGDNGLHFKVQEEGGHVLNEW